MTMEPRDAKKRTVLCVDDTPANLRFLSELLKDEYRVKVAIDGPRALKIASAAPPDIILLDIMLPGMDGLEVCRRLKADPVCRDVPVLFLTAKSEPEDEAYGIGLGAADYIHKPVSPPILLARVRHHLEIQQYHDLIRHRAEWLEGELERRESDVERMQDATIHVITTLAEFRDEATGNHIRRTQEYVRLIAESASKYPEHRTYLTPGKILQVVNSAPLHDVGKVTIPDNILLKPGPLTPEEFEIMKLHSARGDDLLARAMKNLGNTGGFLETARLIARSHHERWDGSGYPDGLSEVDIPLPARIMAVADVYDALRSERPYKGTMTHEEALSILTKGRGTHFDPELLDIFVSSDEQVRYIANHWDDR